MTNLSKAPQGILLDLGGPEEAKKLTSASNIGGLETFYMHAMRFYIPQLVKITFESYGLGIKVCNMQGLKRRNKEPKNTYTYFINKTTNLITQNLKQLYDVYEYSSNYISRTIYSISLSLSNAIVFKVNLILPE